MRMLIAAALAFLFLSTPAHAETLQVEGGALAYETCGRGKEAIVLLHDGVLHSAVYDDVWPLLCERFRVVRYDRRGYGRSPAASMPYSPLDDLAAVMRAARMEHATIVGASAGGGLAIDFALAHPDEVDRLVLVGAAISGFRPSEHFMRRNQAIFAPLQRGDFAAFVATGVQDRYVLAPGHDAQRRRIAELVTANPQNITHTDPARAAPPAKDRLATLRAPTLILAGEYDIPDVHAQAGAAEAMIAAAQRVVVADSGHVIALDQPQALADLIAGFVTAGATASR